MQVYSWTDESTSIFKGQTQEIEENVKNKGTVDEIWQGLKFG